MLYSMSAKNILKTGKKPQKKRELTLRQKNLRRRILKGNTSVTQAMIDSGYSKNTAQALQKETLAKLGIPELMDEMGMNDKRLLQVLDDGLKADKIISSMIISKSGDEMQDAHGLTKDFVEVPDHPTRHKFLDSALKLKSHYPKEKIEIEGLKNLSERLARAITRVKNGKG